MITYEQVRHNPDVVTYIKKSDETLKAMGFTEHSFAHVGRCAHTVAWLLKELCYDERIIELGRIAALLHDIGNMVNRVGHAHHGAVMAFYILNQMGMPAGEITEIVTAIGHHDEGTALALTPINSALILADKCDVRESRVRNYHPDTRDIHDRVNYAVKKSKLTLQKEQGTITLSLKIDSEICSVADYFEIFLGRMLLCRQAAAFFDLEFKLNINGNTLL